MQGVCPPLRADFGRTSLGQVRAVVAPRALGLAALTGLADRLRAARLAAEGCGSQTPALSNPLQRGAKGLSKMFTIFLPHFSPKQARETEARSEP